MELYQATIARQHLETQATDLTNWVNDLMKQGESEDLRFLQGLLQETKTKENLMKATEKELLWIEEMEEKSELAEWYGVAKTIVFSISDVLNTLNDADIFVKNHFRHDNEEMGAYLSEDRTYHIDLTMEYGGGNELEINFYKDDIEEATYVVDSLDALECVIEECKSQVR